MNDRRNSMAKEQFQHTNQLKPCISEPDLLEISCAFVIEPKRPVDLQSPPKIQGREITEDLYKFSLKIN